VFLKSCGDATALTILELSEEEGRLAYWGKELQEARDVVAVVPPAATGRMP
jgi:hypothetical protein